MKAAYRIGKIWGIPLKIHISLFLLLAYISLYAFASSVRAHGIGGGLLSVLAVVVLQMFIFASIGLHELGHSFVALRKGCKVREITLLMIGGAAMMENIPRRPRDEFLMAIAGPAVSATLAGILGWFSWHFPIEENPSNLLTWAASILFFFTALANGMLALFNLLPAYPMDGGRILRALLTPHLGRLHATRIAMHTGQGLAVLIGFVALRGIEPWMRPWNLPLLLIAAFVFVTGKREYRQVQLETLLEQRGFATFSGNHRNRTGEAPPLDEHTVLISPPPYQQGPADRAPIEKLTRRRFPFFGPER